MHFRAVRYDASREKILVVVRVHMDCYAQLFEVVCATGALGQLLLLRCQRGQQHRRQDCDNDSDDDEEFDQREGTFSCALL